jgi:hypothetical protein
MVEGLGDNTFSDSDPWLVAPDRFNVTARSPAGSRRRWVVDTTSVVSYPYRGDVC